MQGIMQRILYEAHTFFFLSSQYCILKPDFFIEEPTSSASSVLLARCSCNYHFCRGN